MRILVSALLVLTAAACATPTTPASAPSLPDDGLPSWTTVGRQYAGPPVGGRGGRYVIDVCPDGRYHHLLLDATVHGTWSPGVIGLVLEHDGSQQSIDLTPDGTDLGGMKYVGAPNCEQ